MILPLLTLIPLALLALVTAALLAALDAAHHAVSRSALDKELAGRSARTREQVLLQHDEAPRTDRKSTRLNSSHVAISYAVFCLKKKKHAVLDAKMKNQKTYSW